MTDLNALLERVRAAAGPDRDIDAALMALSYTQDERHIGAVMEYSDGSEDRVKDLVWVDPKTDRWVSTAAHNLTASIDAALALTERVLPGWWLHGLGKSPLHGLWWCQLYSLDEKRAAEVDEVNIAPLAIIAATLTALIASEPKS